MNGDSGDSTVQSSEPVRSVENEGSGEPLFKKPVENGLSNGVSSGSDKPKSSSSSDKHRSSSHSDKHKSSSSSDKHRSSSSSDKHRSSSSSDKHRSSSSSDKHRSSSSSDKHRSDKHKSSSSDKHRSSSSHKSSSHDKHRSSSSHKSSSGSSSDKHKSSSSSSSHKSSSSGSHKSSSGSSSDKHKSSSSSSHKSSSSSDRPKSSSSHKSSSSEKVKTEVKIEPVVKSEPVEVKEEAPDSDDDVPLGARAVEPPVRSPPRVKQEKRYKEDSEEEDDDDDTPLSARAPPPKKFKQEKVKKRKADSDSEDEYTPVKKKKEVKVKKEPMSPPVKKPSKTPTKTPTKSPTKAPTKGKKGKKQEEEGERWKWWEEDHQDDGTKWHFLEHKGVLFAPEYEPLPDHVEFKYNGKAMKLTPETEEVATFYGRMLDHDYTTKEVFNKNFMKDWRKVMTKEEKETITDLTKCDFRQILAHFKEQSEKRKAMSKEEKKVIKEQNAAIQEEYGFCTMDGHKEKIGNFRIEPPGLFRGRGDHPKMGMHKRRVLARDVIINCSKDAEVPAPPPGQKWKEIRHDNSVSWLASWTENIQNSTKYVMLNASSKLKGQKDWQKYETARKLHKCADKIRAQYQMDWKSKEMRIRQRAVAMYFIDKLALRAGNEKDEGESADTVGCCSLRVEHITLHEEKDGKDYVVEFDFLGKDSIRYNNSVPVEKRVYKNLMLFMDNKSPEDDLFDRLNTATLNKHLQGLMDGLTAKVFRTYNASKTLSEQLQLLTNEEDTVAAKLLSYNRANRAVAILCNHQRAAPKNFDKQMENMQVKIDDKKKAIKTCKKELKAVKAEYKATGSDKARNAYERKKKQQERLEEQLDKLNVALTDKDENKEIALGTSKLNYLDPRISIAWCKKWDVPVEKIYNKTQRDKFTWAMDMADEDFVF